MQAEHKIEGVIETLEIPLSDAVKMRLVDILFVALDLLGSKKFWVAVGGGWATYQTTGDAWAILYAAIAYIGAQGLADFGRSRDEPLF